MTATKHDSSTKPKKSRKPHTIDVAAPEATRMAVVILEVLAGVRSPPDAASALGITSPRYYQLETRALNGLVAALAPRPKGKQPSPENRVRQLERALEASRRDAARQQALVRAAQRSLGIKTPPVIDGKSTDKDQAGRRKRRPTVRALKAARALSNPCRLAEADVVQRPSSSLPSLEAAVCGKDRSPDGVPFIAPGAPR
jgi:hypothetical protein